MIVRNWKDLNQNIKDFISTEEWVGVPEEKRQQVLSDLEDPMNMQTTLHYSEGCDMVKLKIYRPESPTIMNKMVKWIFILGISVELNKYQNTTDRDREL